MEASSVTANFTISDSKATRAFARAFCLTEAASRPQPYFPVRYNVGEVSIFRSLRIGVESVKANAVPIFWLWSMSVALVACYYHSLSFREALEPVVRWQTTGGWRAAFSNGFVFSGILPFFFLVALKSLHVRRPLSTLVAQSVWAGFCGVVSGWMYEQNAVLLGEGVDLSTLLAKTAISQFIWTPVFFNPFGSFVYYWIGHDFFTDGWHRPSPAKFWTEVALPNLIMNWVLWIPCTFLVVMFPTALQIQFSGLVNSVFCLIQLWIGRGSVHGDDTLR